MRFYFRKHAVQLGIEFPDSSVILIKICAKPEKFSDPACGGGSHKNRGTRVVEAARLRATLCLQKCKDV
jgi:hypothetical protein